MAMDGGAIACFRKPFDAPEIVAAVRSVLAGEFIFPVSVPSGDSKTGGRTEKGSASQSRSVRLLVVDDEDALRTVLRSELQSQGFEVDEAGDGDVALTLLKSNDYDIMTLDIKMPRVDGLEVLKAIKNFTHRPDVIMLTGFHSVETMMECKRLGGREFVTLPYNMEELLAIVRRVLHERSVS